MRLFLCMTATCLFGATCYAGCEARSEVRQTLRKKLKDSELDKLKFVDRAARQRQVLEDLIAQYPGEAEPYKRLITFALAPAAAARTTHRSATTSRGAAVSAALSALRDARCAVPDPCPPASQHVATAP